jgi:flavin reductase ActVB
VSEPVRSVASDGFRKLASGFASGVTVVTTLGADGKPQGFTASSFTSVSLAPPLVLVCLDVKADCHPAFERAEHFAVSILAADQKELASRFATRGGDKFAGLAFTAGLETKAPLADGALAHIECRMHARHAAGDHTVLIGEVVGGARFDREPLLYHARSFGHFRAQ